MTFLKSKTCCRVKAEDPRQLQLSTGDGSPEVSDLFLTESPELQARTLDD